MAVNDAADFGKQLDREFEQKVTAPAVLILQKTGLELLSRVVLKTPVKDGFARGSWQVTIETRTDAQVETPDKSGAATIEKGRAVIMPLTDLRTIWLQSNLVYIGKLEGGSSTQAPAGMVAVSIAEVQTMFGRAQ